MAPNLTIRNLTPVPLHLTSASRFAAEKISRGGTLSNARGVFASFFNATDFPTKELHPAGRLSSAPASHVIDPFETLETDVPAPEPKAEVVRLTFEAQGLRYETDAPGPLNRSMTMAKLDGEGEDFTTVYLSAHSFLAVLSSTHLPSWMSPLHDDLALSSLSIPGTHNSPTCYFALPSVRCQVASVRSQLDNGVRFLDVRVSAESGSDRMPLVHSAFPVSLAGTRYFHEFLAECYAFLDENPRECLVVSLKREGTGRAGDEGMSRHLRDGHIARDPERWFTASHIPRLGEARGRIVLVRRFTVDERVRADNGGEFGVDAESWPDNCADGTTSGPPGGQVRVQDFYEVDQSTNIERKISFSRAHLERAAEESHPRGGYDAGEAPPFFVNFLSASNFFNATCWPERVAAKVNPAIVEYLCMRHGVSGKGEVGLGVGDGATGIVVTDWVGAHGDWDLIRCVVSMNARLLVEQQHGDLGD